MYTLPLLVLLRTNICPYSILASGPRGRALTTDYAATDLKLRSQPIIYELLPALSSRSHMLLLWIFITTSPLSLPRVLIQSLRRLAAVLIEFAQLHLLLLLLAVKRLVVGA